MKYVSLPLTLFLIFTAVGCPKAPSSPEALSSKDPQTLAIKLKQGIKIKLKYVELEKESGKLGKWVEREVTLENPSGAEGVALLWNEAVAGPQQPESAPLPQGQVITIDGGGNLTDPLKGLMKPGGGQLSLPNLTQARRMTLPAFWPHGDLYLSDSSGIWLSDVAFEEIKREGKTAWDAGLLANPLLGPAEGLPVFMNALAYLQDGLKEEQDKIEDGGSLKRQGEKKFTLEIDGKAQTVDVVEMGNWLARLTVLDNAQNPLILAFQVAPEASPAELLFSPLGILKGLVEYQVMGFKNPKRGEGL
jgi:hypothetical protein